MTIEAREYVEHGWLLVPFPRGTKGPLKNGWNDRDKVISDPDIAEYLDENIGLCHAYSGTCCFDIDDLEATRKYFSKKGLNLDLILNAENAVLISSGRENRAKLLYKLDTPRPTYRLGDTKKTAFELRCATQKGTTVQDVLPPSIHPTTQQPYTWKYNASRAHWTKLPSLPPELDKLWLSLMPDKNAPSAPVVHGTKNMGKARELLYRHSPDCGYEAWVQAGMALHHECEGGLDGLNLWDEWSARSPKYQGRRDLESHWASFGTSPRPITLASLRMDEAAVPDEFDIVREEAIAALPSTEVTFTDAERKVIARLPRTDNGRLLATLPNLQTALSIPAFARFHFAYDEFKDSLMFAPVGTQEWQVFKDTDYTRLRIFLEGTGKFNPVSREFIRDTIHFIAEGNKMDSAQLWLDTLTWDGQNRIEEFFPRYMGTENSPYARAIGVYWWTALAGRIIEPGVQADMIPILVGKQGVGKSTGIAAMVPDPQFFTEIHLEEPDEVIARKMRGLLIGELAEMRGLRTAAIERILQFVTRKHEKWVPKYYEFATTFARRCMMMGTSNDDELLFAEENRRWLPIMVEYVNRDGIIRDRDQLWAEGAVRFKQQGIVWSAAEKLAKGEHVKFKSIDSWQGLIAQYLDKCIGRVKVHDVLVDGVGLDPRNIRIADEKRAGAVMRNLGWDKKMFRDGKRIARFWYKPEETDLTA